MKYKVVLFFFVALFLLGVPFHIEAAKKSASIVIASGQFLKKPHVVRTYFSNFKGVSKISYVFMYEGNGVGQGIEGSFVPGKKKSYSKDLFLGTCSKKVCIRHGNIRKMVFEVTTKFSNGKSSTKIIKIK